MDNTVKPQGWEIESLSPQVFNKVCAALYLARLILQTDPFYQATEGFVLAHDLAHENEGLHTILVSPLGPLSDTQIQTKIRAHFKHYDFFTMVKQASSIIPGTIQWVVEWSDADATRACATYLYNLSWVNVSCAYCLAKAMGNTNVSTLGGWPLLVPRSAILSR